MILTLIGFATSRYNDETALTASCSSDNIDIVKLMLSHTGLNINQGTRGIFIHYFLHVCLMKLN